MDLSQSRESLFLSSITYFNNLEKCDLFNIYEIKISDLFKKASKAKSIYQWPGCASFPQDTGWHNFAGRLAISDTSIYMTAGFIDSDAYTNVKLQTAPELDGSLFGQVIKIDLATFRVQEFASGLRSPAGIVTVDLPEGDVLYVTEHGPKGGDELNFISKGSDYGWPKVSLGLPYVGNDVTGADTRYGTHQGFAPPMFSWTPSIAPSAIIELSESLDGYGSWQKGDLVFGTLKNQSLVRIKISNQQTVTTVEEMKIGFRIRDLEQVGDVVVLGSDDGRIATIKKKSKLIGDGPYPSVDELSPIYKVPGLGQISKFFDDFIISVFQAVN
jgi:glucose/arabinose dehydrogenase